MWTWQDIGNIWSIRAETLLWQISVPYENNCLKDWGLYTGFRYLPSTGTFHIVPAPHCLYYYNSNQQYMMNSLLRLGLLTLLGTSLCIKKRKVSFHQKQTIQNKFEARYKKEYNGHLPSCITVLNKQNNRIANVSSVKQMSFKSFPKGCQWLSIIIIVLILGSLLVFYHTPRGVSKRSVIYSARNVELRFKVWDLFLVNVMS